MFPPDLNLGLRNLMLLQLLLIIAAPEYALLVRRELINLWKSISTPSGSRPDSRRKKKDSFWEIDLTKFEP